MSISSSSGGSTLLASKTVNVLYDPQNQSFSYSGDIDPTTEQVTIYGTGTAPINFILEGAVWASVPIKWVNASKQAIETPNCMEVTVIDGKKLVIDDCCESPGTYRFLVCVNSAGTVVCSDPKINNDPAGP
ncbi:MAG: hypothetical protein KDD11_09695 [Acidobacteria bacterium]|nr:hypothetical protein [Acidobacteriota bacterium]